MNRPVLLICCALSISMTTHATITTINSMAELNTLTKNKPTVIKFWAPWCSICQSIAEPFQEIAQDSDFATIQFATVDITEQPDLSKEMHIMGVPTFIYFKDGKKIYQSVGIHDLRRFAPDLRNTLMRLYETPETNLAPEILADAQISDEISAEETIMMLTADYEDEAIATAIDVPEEIQEKKAEQVNKQPAAEKPQAKIQPEEIESEEVPDLMDHFAEPTIFEQIIHLIKTAINFILDLLLWLPRTVIGLLHLLFK